MIYDLKNSNDVASVVVDVTRVISENNLDGFGQYHLLFNEISDAISLGRYVEIDEEMSTDGSIPPTVYKGSITSSFVEFNGDVSKCLLVIVLDLESWCGVGSKGFAFIFDVDAVEENDNSRPGKFEKLYLRSAGEDGYNVATIIFNHREML